MTRVKRGTTSNKTRRNKLAMTKGYRFGRKSKESMANEAIRHAGKNAFKDRKRKKREYRQLWTINLSAALRAEGVSYSKFIGMMKKKNIMLDRKVMAEIAEKTPAAFKRFVAEVQK